MLSQTTTIFDVLMVDIDHVMSFLPLIAYLFVLLYIPYFLLLQSGKMIVSLLQRRQPEEIESSSTISLSSTRTKNDGTQTTTTTTMMLLSLSVSIIVYDGISSLVATTSFMNNNNDHHGGLHDLLKGTDPLLNEILKLVPSIRKGPSIPLLFSNRHVQFIPWLIQNEIHRREGIPFQRIDIDVTGCEDKTSTHAEGFLLSDCISSPRMNDIITIDVFPPFDDSSSTDDSSSSYSKNFNRSSPVIFFMPGLRCYSQDMPGNMIIRRAYAEGFRSIVVNRRGHTPGMKLKAPRWNLFGDVEDLEQIYWYVKEELVEEHNTPFFLHGISSGTAVVVSALSKWDYQREQLSQRQQNHHYDNDTHYLPSSSSTIKRKIPSFVASTSITPGYDISKVLSPERFKFPYNGVLTTMVKQHFVLQNEQLLRSYNSEAVDATLRATTLQQFVDAAAPFAGYSNASEYYRHTNPTNNLQYITTPKLVLNSIDDPCCDIDNLYENSLRHQNKTYAQIVMESPSAIVAVTRAGSHCPFLEGGTLFPSFIRDPLHTNKRRYMLNSWADQVSIEFYKATLEVYGRRPS